MLFIGNVQEKLQTAPPLLPMLLEGQPFIDEQDELSVTDFMRKFGMPERINEEVFVAMAKALDFIDPGTPYIHKYTYNIHQKNIHKYIHTYIIGLHTYIH